jgi:hypothetical protein
MTIKDLKKHFNIGTEKFNGGYMLFALETGNSRMVHKYLCMVYKNEKSFYVEGYKPTGKIEKLKEQVKDYVSKLPYDSEYYMPRWRPELFVEFIILDYIWSLGFQRLDGNCFKLASKNIYGYVSNPIIIWISGLQEMREDVEVCLGTGRFSWVSSTCKREPEAIKQALTNILKPLMTTDSVINLQNAEKLGTVSDIDLSINKITGNLNKVSVDYKQELKKRLLEIAESI